MTDLYVDQADDETVNVGPIIAADGTYLAVTPATFTTTLVVKASKNATDASGKTYVGTFSGSDTAGWVAQFTIPKADLATLGFYFYRCRVVDPDGKVQTAAAGRWRVDTGRGSSGQAVSTPSQVALGFASHTGAVDPHVGYRLESVPITAGDLGFDVATQAELDAQSATFVPLAGPATIAGLKDFTTAPTVNGAPIGGGVGAGVPTVLQWNNATPQSVYHGRMWPVGVNLGPFWWECWCAPTAGAEYWISEGYGGAHAILAGFNGAGVPAGNLWSGVTTTGFLGSYTAQSGEWLHYAVTWDGANVWVLINGIVVGVKPFAGPRQAQFGTVLIGGSDHSNFAGRIAQVRAWEGNVPTGSPWVGGGNVDRHFGGSWNDGTFPSQFATSYLVPGDTFPDISAGYGGRHHPGHSYVGNGISIDSAGPHPTRVADLTAPFGNQSSVARTRTFTAPVAAPAGAKLWDSFGRADSIPAFTTIPTPGSTEGGSLGVKTWEVDAGQWGVFDGAAICLNFFRFARVANNSADMDVRVGRVVANGLYYCSAAARVNAARTSGWYAYMLDPTSVTLVRPDGTVAGSWTPASTTWTRLRLAAAGTTFTVYVDDGIGGWTQLGSVNGETQNQTEVGAGMYHYFGVGTAARYTDFEVR